MRRTLVVLLCLLMLCGAARAEFVFVEDMLEDPAETMDGGIVFSDGEASDDTPVEILITAAGDVTLGGNMKDNPKSNIYTKALAAKEGDLSYFLAGVQDYFAQDDMTLVNFEGALTEITRPYKDNKFTFRAPPEHVQALTLGSVEAVALENNHVMDFGADGLADTKRALEGAGIVYSAEDEMGVYEVSGVSIAMLAYQTFDNQYPRLLEKVPQEVAAAKAAHDIVIVSYHWGAEEDYYPNDNQIKMGRATIDAGADLVLGHHSHRINPIELYNGKYIVYSLANCSFSGNIQPSDMDTFLFQQKFTVSGNTVTSGGFRIIPCSISSISGLAGKKSAENDFAITPFEPDSDAAKRVIDTMLKNGKRLDYAVEAYPTEWE